MSNNSYYPLLAKIFRNVLVSAMSFVFILISGLALMKVLSITMQIPELRMANQFSVLVMAKVFGYLVLGLVGACAAIKSEQYRKQ